MSEFKRVRYFGEARDLEVPEYLDGNTIRVTVPKALVDHIASTYPRDQQVRNFRVTSLLLAVFGEEAGAEVIWRRIEADPLYLSRIPQELVDRMPNDITAREEFRAQFA